MDIMDILTAAMVLIVAGGVIWVFWMEFAPERKDKNETREDNKIEDKD